MSSRSDRNQTSKLIDWETSVDGDGRVWAVEAATGLGHLLSQQLIASGETVVDVPPVLASRIRVLSSGTSNKNNENDARSVAIAAYVRPPRQNTDRQRIQKRYPRCTQRIRQDSRASSGLTRSPSVAGSSPAWPTVSTLSRRGRIRARTTRRRGA